MASSKAIILFIFSFTWVISSQGQDKSSQRNARDTLPIKYDSLKAAVVKAPVRPKMKGDTLEYNTENILLRPNAAVEDLLRRLPGLHIDPDGTITFNHEKIQHLLVDGEDIFGSDPTLITRNFDAEKIARVEILNKKSDRAIFTGVDDGNVTKTLNLVLKESAKNGYFGKMEGGSDVSGNYTGAGLLAGFRAKEQFTALGFTSNTGMLGLSNDQSGSTREIMVIKPVPDPLGASAGIGIPQMTVGAFHYANTWNGPANHVAVNYQYGYSWTNPKTVSQTFQTQPDSIYGQQVQSQSINRQDQQLIKGIYDWALNTKSALRFEIHGNRAHAKNQFDASANSTFNDTVVNSSQRSIRDEVSRQDFGGEVFWRLQTGKRTPGFFSLNAVIRRVQNRASGYLYSLNQFYQSGGPQSQDTVDQRKVINDNSLAFTNRINYAHPLWNGSLFGISYEASVISDNPFQESYSPGDGKYDELVDSLSSNLHSVMTSQLATVNLQGKVNRFLYSLGTDWLDYSYKQQDLIADTLLHLHYTNWAPRLQLQYRMSPAINIVFNYKVSTQQPSATQLEPIKNNSDPLHLYLGNPDLKVGTNQNFGLNINYLKAWMVGLGLSLTLNSNAISTRTITDNQGRQISQPANVDGGTTAAINFSIERKLLGIGWGIHSANYYSRTVNFVNAALSRNDVANTGGGFSATKDVADKFSFMINTNFYYFTSVSSINTSAPVHYWTQSQLASARFYLIPNYEIGSSASYTWQEKTSAFSANSSVLLWNAYISRNCLNNKLVLKLLLNNILNQNAGISRANAANVNTETSTNILGRYWIFSVTYRFDKKFKRK